MYGIFYHKITLKILHRARRLISTTTINNFGAKLKNKFSNVKREFILDRKISQEKTNQDPAYVKFLFFFYLIFFFVLFLFQGETANYIARYALTPIIFLPLQFCEKKLWGLNIPFPEKISTYNILRNLSLCKSPLFIAALIYSLDKAILSYELPEQHQLYFYLYFQVFLAPLMIFLITTARIFLDFENFNKQFFSYTGLAVAANALINIKIYFQSLPSLASIPEQRMYAAYGAAIGGNPNMDGLVYAIFLAGSLITAIKLKNRFYFLIFSPIITILALTLFLEQCRGPIIALLLSLGIISLVIKKDFRKGAGALTATLVTAMMAVPKVRDSTINRGENQRLEIWQKYFGLIHENPIFGYGDRAKFSIPLNSGEKAPHAHNILLAAQLRGGVIGLISLLFIFTFGLLRTYNYARLNQKVTPLCLLLIVTIAGMVDFDLVLWRAGWEWGTYWLAIGLAIGADNALRRS